MEIPPKVRAIAVGVPPVGAKKTAENYCGLDTSQERMALACGWIGFRSSTFR
jgi:hypothetical protein